MANAENQAFKHALQWHLDHGVDEALFDAPQNALQSTQSITQNIQKTIPQKPPQPLSSQPVQGDILGSAEAKIQALELVRSCQTLDDLSQAIQNFEGLSIKKTASNMVFCDGNPKARVMLIGEAPGADEDRQGKPFVGVSGQLLDKILACIGLSRQEEDPAKSVYISNILNWRPPGNRTPSPQEIDISLPFIEKHIELIGPQILILCGGVSAKSLLQRSEGISKLRAQFHDYTPVSEGVASDQASIPALATYHPAYLLRTPAQKRLVWADMLMLQQRLRELGL